MKFELAVLLPTSKSETNHALRFGARTLCSQSRHTHKTRNYSQKALLCMRIAFPYTTRELEINVPWNWLKRKVLLFGSAPFLFKSLGLLYIKTLSRMLSHFAITGSPCEPHLPVLAAQDSQLNMFSRAQKDSPPSVIMRLGIWQQTCSLKSAMMFVLSLTFSLLMVKYSPGPPWTLRMVQNLTSLQTVSGVVALSALSLMCGSSTLMLRLTDTLSCLPAIESMSWKRNASTNNGWERWSMPPLLLLSATGGMANEATIFYKRLASCLATKWDQPYSPTMSWLHCRLTSLLRSAIQCIRGARSSCGHATKSPTPPMDLVNSELDFTWTHYSVL